MGPISIHMYEVAVPTQGFQKALKCDAQALQIRIRRSRALYRHCSSFACELQCGRNRSLEVTKSLFELARTVTQIIILNYLLTRTLSRIITFELLIALCRTLTRSQREIRFYGKTKCLNCSSLIWISVNSLLVLIKYCFLSDKKDNFSVHSS